MANALGTLILKDLSIEFRTRMLLNTVLIFGLVILLAFRFAFPDVSAVSHSLLTGILWVAISFTALFPLLNSFAHERESGTLIAILISPVNHAYVFISKVLINFIFISFISGLTLVLVVVFFNVNLSAVVVPLFAIIFLGSFGLASLGTFLAAMAASTKHREVMLPILLLPLIVFPVLMPSISATIALFESGSLAPALDQLRLVAFMDIVFFLAAAFLFEYVVRD